MEVSSRERNEMVALRGGKIFVEVVLKLLSHVKSELGSVAFAFTGQFVKNWNIFTRITWRYSTYHVNWVL